MTKKSSVQKKVKSRASARVVDGKLILSFPDALTPVLWQMDMHEAKASALVVRPSSSEGTGATLTLKSARGESLAIADFSDREEAVQGLMVISKALESADGRIRPPASFGGPVANEYESRPIMTYRKKGSAWKWIVGIAAAIIIVTLMTVWGSLTPSVPGTLESAAYAPPPVSPQETSGVPVSADDYLKDY